MKRIAFYTLGCKVNQADSASMEELFLRAGYEVVPFGEAAEVYLVNTCVVTNMGQAKSRKLINRVLREHPDSLLVVAGCYPQTALKEVETLGEIGLIIGNQDRKNVVALVEKALAGREKLNCVHELRAGLPFEELCGGNEVGKTRAYLKIQEGCNQFCTYCIIPYARGPLRSRSLGSIRAEVSELVQQGYLEVTLIGIHLGCYGKEKAGSPSLADAVAAALENKELRRLRLGSLESVEVEDRLLDLMERDGRLCRHLHLPLQSGSDSILKAMGRPYDTAKFLELLTKIRSRIPDIAITTDIITGFPGETEENFQETLDFARQAGFSKIHAFPYSQRQGTPAAAMPQQVAEQLKTERTQRLIALDEELHMESCRTLCGKTVEVLFETCRSGLWSGFSSNYIRVYAPGEEVGGKILPVLVDHVFEDGVFGKIVV